MLIKIIALVCLSELVISTNNYLFTYLKSVGLHDVNCKIIKEMSDPYGFVIWNNLSIDYLKNIQKCVDPTFKDFSDAIQAGNIEKVNSIFAHLVVNVFFGPYPIEFKTRISDMESKFKVELSPSNSFFCTLNTWRKASEDGNVENLIWLKKKSCPHNFLTPVGIERNYLQQLLNSDNNINEIKFSLDVKEILDFLTDNLITIDHFDSSIIDDVKVLDIRTAYWLYSHDRRLFDRKEASSLSIVLSDTSVVKTMQKEYEMSDFLSIIKKYEFRKENNSFLPFTEAIKLGNDLWLNWLKEIKYPLHGYGTEIDSFISYYIATQYKDVAKYAIDAKNIQVLDWLFDRGFIVTEKSCRMALKQRDHGDANLAVYNWFFYHGCSEHHVPI
jgi:hypothetical protein